MPDYIRWKHFDKAGNAPAAKASTKRDEDGDLDEKIIAAAGSEMYTLNTEVLVEAVYPSIAQNRFDPHRSKTEAALYWALWNVIEGRVKDLVSKGVLFTVWDQDYQIAAFLTRGKLYQLQTFGFVNFDDGVWVCTNEAENNYYRLNTTPMLPVTDA